MWEFCRYLRQEKAQSYNGLLEEGVPERRCVTAAEEERAVRYPSV